MRRGIVVSTLLVLVLAGVAVADEATTNWQHLMLEAFDDPDMQWIVQPSKFIALEDNPDGFEYDFPFAARWVPDVIPEALGEPTFESDTPGVLGVQASFTRRGYNSIEFIPAAEGADGELVPSPLVIEGRPMSIDLWAWGSNYDYYLEIQIQDHRGVVHTVPVGSVGFGGWRNLEVRIPNYIPRQVRFVPQRRVMALVKVILWTRPDEAVDGFHFYLDEIQVLTDVFETPFDGEGLASPEFVQEIWDTEQRQ